MMKRIAKITALGGCLSLLAFVGTAFPYGQILDVNGSGVVFGEHWDLTDALTNRSPGDGRTINIRFAQGTSSSRISKIETAHGTWENVVAIDFANDGRNRVRFVGAQDGIIVSPPILLGVHEVRCAPGEGHGYFAPLDSGVVGLGISLGMRERTTFVCLLNTSKQYCVH